MKFARISFLPVWVISAQNVERKQQITAFLAGSLTVLDPQVVSPR